MARTLDQIIRETKSLYDPQRQSYQKEINALPGLQKAEESGLNQAKKDSFQQIAYGANRRGLNFSGIPLAEQAEYTADTYLPSLANLKNRFLGVREGLVRALSGVDQSHNAYARSIWDSEQAAARAGSGGGGGGFGFDFASGANDGGGGYGYQQKDDGGFAFVDNYGNPISAAQYSAATGTSFRNLLQYMANQGDAGAKAALGFVGDDYGYDSAKIGGNQGLYNSLVWGTGMPQASAPVSASRAISAGTPSRPMGGGIPAEIRQDLDRQLYNSIPGFMR